MTSPAVLLEIVSRPKKVIIYVIACSFAYLFSKFYNEKVETDFFHFTISLVALIPLFFFEFMFVVLKELHPFNLGGAYNPYYDPNRAEYFKYQNFGQIPDPMIIKKYERWSKCKDSLFWKVSWRFLKSVC